MAQKISQTQTCAVSNLTTSSKTDTPCSEAALLRKEAKSAVKVIEQHLKELNPKLYENQDTLEE